MSARTLLNPALFGMGLHVASVRVRRALLGHRRYPGSAEAILRAGLEDCWSGEFLTASPGHYRQFWTRDTGFAAGALVGLGGAWPARLHSSLAWAMETWQRRGSHVSTTIDPLLRRPVDIFHYGVDSLPMLLASLHALARSDDLAAAAAAEALARQHADWIEAEVRYFVDLVVDPQTGLVRSDRHFSAHRDTFRNSSTAYANTMVALLARTIAETGWGPDLLSQHFDASQALEGRGESRSRAWGSLLRRHFWTGDWFRDRPGADEISGEGNVLPFWTGVIDDPGMLTAAIQTLQRAGYTTPHPLRFTVGHTADGLLLAYRLWSADYQTTTSWTSLGSMYLALLRRVDPPAAAIELGRMAALIEEHGTFWEVLDREGRPWRSRSRLSVSDVSMLWGAIFLEAHQAP